MVLGPQLLGGRDGWGISILAAGTGAASIALALGLRRTDPDLRATGLWAMVVLAIVWTAFQALPLPRILVEWLQPEVVDLTDAASALLGESPRSVMPLSFSPQGTQTEIVKALACASAFFAGWVAAVGGRRDKVLVAVAVSTLVMALVALAHLAADADLVFGVVEHPAASPAILAPLFNVNQLSGFLAMGTPLLVALAIHAKQRGPRYAWLLAAVVTGATALLSLSRGGAASLVGGLVLLGALGLRHRSGRSGTPLLLVGATVAGVLGLGLYVASEGLLHEFEDGDFSKLELMRQGVDLAFSHPWVGVGRGAFSAAFVAEHGVQVRFTHPENLIAQWTSEWGILLGTVFLIVALGAGWRALRRTRGWVHFGGVAALASIAAHDLVDFALEQSGVAIVVGALAGALFAPHRRSKAEPTRAPRAWAMGLATGAVAIVAVGVIGWRIDARNTWALQDRLVTLLEDGETDEFRELLQHATRLHPAEPALPLLAGAEAGRRGDPAAIPWLNRAMVLAPGWPSPHIETARFLAGRGLYGQAYLEIRAAEERHTGTPTFRCGLLRAHPETVDLFVRAARTDSIGLALMDHTAHCLPLTSEATQALDHTLREHDVRRAHLREARRLLGADDHEGALEILQPLCDDQDLTTRLLWAEALVAAGRVAHAVDALRGAEEWADDPEAILRARARAATAAGDGELMRATVQALRGRASGRARRVAETWVLQGQLEKQLENDGRAMQAYERAHRIDASSGALVHIARLSEELGSLGRALRAYTDLCAGAGPSGRWCAERDRLQRRIRESPHLPGQLLGAP